MVKDNLPCIHFQRTHTHAYLVFEFQSRIVQEERVSAGNAFAQGSVIIRLRYFFNIFLSKLYRREYFSSMKGLT